MPYLLTDLPVPAVNNGRGIHGTGQASSSHEYYESQIYRWQHECRFTWATILGEGLSQVETCRKLAEAGIMVLYRHWLGDHANPRRLPEEAHVKMLVQEGHVRYFAWSNEFYNPSEWDGGFPLETADVDTWWVAPMAENWAAGANLVLRAGGIPLLPAIEVWRFEKVAKPLYRYLAEHYPELLAESVINVHARTANHPPSYEKDQTGFQGYKAFIRFLKEMGFRLGAVSTETGPEVGWDQDRGRDPLSGALLFPPVTEQMHADWWAEIVTMPWEEELLGVGGWLWDDSGVWNSATWINNNIYGRSSGGVLPVVARLAALPDVLRGPQPEMQVPLVDLERQAKAAYDRFNWLDKVAAMNGLTDQVSLEFYFTAGGRIHVGKVYLDPKRLVQKRPQPVAIYCPDGDYRLEATHIYVLPSDMAVGSDQGGAYARVIGMASLGGLEHGVRPLVGRDPAGSGDARGEGLAARPGSL